MYIQYTEYMCKRAHWGRIRTENLFMCPLAIRNTLKRPTNVGVYSYFLTENGLKQCLFIESNQQDIFQIHFEGSDYS